MAMTRRGFLAAGITLGVAGVLGLMPRPVRARRASWYQFGTRVDMILLDEDVARADRALARLGRAFAHMNEAWHPWRPGPMATVNRALAAGRAISVDADLRRMVRQIQRLYRASGGTFNPVIGRLIGLWGFHGTPQDGWRPPLDAVVEALRDALPTPEALHLDGNLLSSTHPGAALDLGGYAKGYALDRGRDLLRAAGIDHALINAGGDLAVLGDAGGRPWRVAVRHPQRPGVLAWLAVTGNEAVATSGDYERFHEYAGRRYAHIIDPRSARPVRGTASATVVHSEAAVADAAATALMVAGPGAWRETARALGVETALVIDHEGHLEATPDMAARLHRMGA